jgi:hypothetical protein
MKAEEFDEKFDSGEDITSCLDVSTIRRPGCEQRRLKIIQIILIIPPEYRRRINTSILNSTVVSNSVPSLIKQYSLGYFFIH